MNTRLSFNWVNGSCCKQTINSFIILFSESRHLAATMRNFDSYFNAASYHPSTHKKGHTYPCCQRLFAIHVHTYIFYIDIQPRRSVSPIATIFFRCVLCTFTLKVRVRVYVFVRTFVFAELGMFVFVGDCCIVTQQDSALFQYFTANRKMKIKATANREVGNRKSTKIQLLHKKGSNIHSRSNFRL